MTATAVGEAGGDFLRKRSRGKPRSQSTLRADCGRGGHAAEESREKVPIARYTTRRSRASKGARQPKPGKTCFGTLSAGCSQKMRECVHTMESNFASDAFSVTNAPLLGESTKQRRMERPPTAIQPHLRTHSRVFWQLPRKTPPEPSATDRIRPQRERASAHSGRQAQDPNRQLGTMDPQRLRDCSSPIKQHHRSRSKHA